MVLIVHCIKHIDIIYIYMVHGLGLSHGNYSIPLNEINFKYGVIRRNYNFFDISNENQVEF